MKKMEIHYTVSFRILLVRHQLHPSQSIVPQDNRPVTITRKMKTTKKLYSQLNE